MVGEVFAGMTAFKAMFDITKSLKDMDDAVRRNAAVADLWEQIIAAQMRYTAAVEQVGELREELTRFETWESEKQRYELKDLYRGFYAYVPKVGMEQGEPPHALCTNCYNKSFKSILQSSGHIIIHEHFWLCPSCNTKIKSQAHDMASMIKRAREAHE